MLVAQGNLDGGAEILPRQPRHHRAPGQGRPRQRRLAARSVGVATTRSATCWWRRATSTEALKAYRDSLAISERLAEVRSRQCRLAARSVGVATARSATCWWRRASSTEALKSLPRRPRHRRACPAPPARRRYFHTTPRGSVLPTAVAAIGGGQALSNSKAIPVALERVIELALRAQHVLADLVVPDREIALPAAIAGSAAARRSRMRGSPGSLERPVESPCAPARRRPCRSSPRDRAAAALLRSAFASRSRWRGYPGSLERLVGCPARSARRRPSRADRRDRAANRRCCDRRRQALKWRGYPGTPQRLVELALRAPARRRPCRANRESRCQPLLLRSAAARRSEQNARAPAVKFKRLFRDAPARARCRPKPS